MSDPQRAGGFRSAAQRKLDALKAANRKWQTRDEDDEGAAGGDSPTDTKKHKADHAAAAAAAGSVAAASSAARAASSSADAVDDDSDAPVVVSDASAAEQAMLAAMGITGFGRSEKRAGPDLAAITAQHVRKQPGAPAAVQVKKEGEAPKEQTQPSQASTHRPAPRKVAPVAPPSLLGGAYDDSDDSDDESAGGASAAAASASSAAAAAASSNGAAVSTDDDDSDDDAPLGPDGKRQNPLLRTLPITHEVSLKTNGHTKTVSALSVDSAGSRVLSGGYDYQAKMWDFGGMNESLAAFRTIEPQEGHQVRSLTWSQTSDMFLAVTGGAQPKVYTRDAGEVATLARGDMYIMDQKLTNGHSTPVTSGWWHPRDRAAILTSGIDGTVRIWDLHHPNKNLSVIKPRGVQRGTPITATAFSRDGKMVAAAAGDGSIHLMRAGAKALEYRDGSVMSNAHLKGSETSALLFASDGFTLFSRGGDHTLKQWDVRAFRQPLAVVADLENSYPETDMALSPDERVLVTGTSARDATDAASGHAVFIERATLEPIQRVSMGCRSVVRSVWHSGINQLLFGCSDGAIRLLYDPTSSRKGVLQCVGRRAKPKDPLDYQEHIGAIITPHALPSMRGAESQSRKRARDKTAAALAPEAPVAGRYGVGGRAAGSQSMAAYHLSKVVSLRADPREKDPREALLAMDALAKADPMFFGRAYKDTQPQTILVEVPEEERMVTMTEEEIALSNKKEGQTK